jgi:alginate O-acetyltransferase complex protein AlgI
MITIVGFNYGIKRFIYGLSKKVILANIFGEVCDQIFAISPSQLAGSVAWLGIICYSLQIYFDFSGYSDMAIGLGRLLGFRYPENFRHPYISQSIQEFWRRWHISLSTWFRDYLYIPLGGNRKGPIRTCLNLMLVFCLCGLWHGASWNFLIWGIIHGIFLSIERFAGGAEKIIMWRPLRHTYAMAVVMLGWVFFRVETLPDAYQYLAAMCNSSTKGMAFVELGDFVTAELIVCIIAGVFCSTPLLVKLRRTLRRRQVRFVRVNVWPIIEICLNGALFLLTLACLVARTHNPFIYFRF